MDASGAGCETSAVLFLEEIIMELVGEAKDVSRRR